jgi:hypothetical protein
MIYLIKNYAIGWQIVVGNQFAHVESQQQVPACGASISLELFGWLIFAEIYSMKVSYWLLPLLLKNG